MRVSKLIYVSVGSVCVDIVATDIIINNNNTNATNATNTTDTTNTTNTHTNISNNNIK